MEEPRIDIARTVLTLGHMQNDILKSEATPVSKKRSQVIKEAGVIPNAARVAAGMRQAGIPVIHIKGIRRLIELKRKPLVITDTTLAGGIGIGSGRDDIFIPGTYGSEIVEELTPGPDDYIIHNYGKSAFYGSPLDVILGRLGIDTIVVGGVATYAYVESTVRDATDRRFNVIVLSDCCASTNIEEHEYCIKNIFPQMARVRTSDEVLALIKK